MRIPSLLNRTAATLAVFLLSVTLVACSNPQSPEDEIRRWITELERAAEAGEIGPLDDAIAPEYRDNKGNDRKSISRIMRVALMTRRPLHLLVRETDLQLVGPELGRVSLVIAGSTLPLADAEEAAEKADAGGRFSLDVVAMSLSIRRKDESWQVIEANWRAAGLNELF